MTKILLALIRFYQFTFSTLMGKNCKFHPSCSHYTADAIRRFGAGRGVLLGAHRICRCGPFSRGGYDPVPEGWQNPFRCDRKQPSIPSESDPR